ncbi:zinc finger protein 35-like [Ctenocephalides felis]|uniref:zinc finger protein 35-like n=1 Tax=Ctenocephalides felis TaxID=7515 RepID=UPI000E6E1AFC|nr:zinc finger protein 35-like [Ctenocephalides felis]
MDVLLEKPIKTEPLEYSIEEIEDDEISVKQELNDNDETFPEQSTQPASTIKQEPTENHLPKPFTCDICHKVFAKLKNLKIHEVIHSGLKNFKCTICDKAFSQSANLTVHLRIHRGDKRLCMQNLQPKASPSEQP